ncbi:hypothetical protein D1007_42218 [Hordeum vulgare]|nr:hypothetical protein D1007_42218 [Hordeum vulgare]
MVEISWANDRVDSVLADTFINNGRPYRITLPDVEHMTRMPCMGKKHIPSNLNDTMELWKELKEPNETKITLKGLQVKMKDDKHLHCLTKKDGVEDGLWFGDEVDDAPFQLMCHDDPIDTRDVQLFYIERMDDAVILKRDDRIERCHEEALAGLHGTTKRTSYVKHDLVFLPTNTSNIHSFLVVINPIRREI